MPKKLISSLDNKKKKPMGMIMKRDSTKKKKGVLKKMLQYLKCDLYMFAPLLSTHPTSHAHTHSLPTGVEANEEGMGEKENKKKVRVGVGEFMMSDCYMYAPLVTPHSHSHPWLHASSITTTLNYTGSMQPDAESVRESELMKKVSNDREEQWRKGRESNQELKANNYPHHTSILRHTILQQKGTVKHSSRKVLHSIFSRSRESMISS